MSLSACDIEWMLWLKVLHNFGNHNGVNDPNKSGIRDGLQLTLLHISYPALKGTYLKLHLLPLFKITTQSAHTHKSVRHHPFALSLFRCCIRLTVSTGSA